MDQQHLGLLVQMIRELKDQVRTLINLEKDTREAVAELRKQMHSGSELRAAFISTSDPFIFNNPLMTPFEGVDIAFSSSLPFKDEAENPFRPVVGGNALVVDDDPFFQNLLIRHLSNLGIKACT